MSSDKGKPSILITAKDEASNVLTLLRKHAKKISVAIVGYFSFKFFKGVVEDAAEFESAMSAVRAASGATTEEFNALKAAAEHAGSTTKYTSVEAAGALENLAKAGLTAKEAIQALPAVLNLAQAGDVELAEAADYVTKAVNGMGLSFADAARVADVLSLGANASQTSVRGLAEAFSFAAPLAKSVGLSLEETVGIIGKFSDAGIDAGRAGTALNNILARFSDTSSQFRGELRAAGITTNDFNQALRQLADLGPAGAGAIQAVGLNAGPALRALLNQGTESLDKLTAELYNAKGSAANFAKIMNDNLGGALKIFSSTWEAFKIKLGTPVLDVLKDQIHALAGRLSAFIADGSAAKFGDAIKKAFETAGKWVQEFLRGVNFEAVSQRMQDFAASVGETFDWIKDKATLVSGGAKVLFGTLSAGINTVLAVIYKLAEGMSWVASAFLADLALISDGIAKVTFGDLSKNFTEAANALREEARAAYHVSDEFGNKSREAGLAAADGLVLAADGFKTLATTAEESADAVTTAAEAAADATTDLGDAIADANKKAADATATLRNELNAQIADLDKQIKTGQLAASVEEKHLQLALEQIRTAEKMARARGDETAATWKTIEAKRMEARLAELKARALDAEAKAHLAKLKATEQEAEAAGTLNEAKKLEIEAEKAAIETKVAEGKISKELAKQLHAEADAALRARDAKKGAGEAGKDLADGADAATKSIGGLNQAAASSGSVAELFTGMWNRAKDAVKTASAEAGEALDKVAATASGFKDFAAQVNGLALSASTLTQSSTLGEMGSQLEALKNQAESAAEGVEKLDKMSRVVGLGFSGFYESLAAMARLEESIHNAKAAQLEFKMAVQSFNAAVGEGNLSLSAQHARLKGLVATAQELGSEELSGLRSALTAVENQLKSLEDSARSVLDSISDELDQISGNYEAIERRRIEARRADIEANRNKARADGNADAVRSLDAALGKLSQLERHRLAEARARAEADRARKADAARPAHATPQGEPVQVNVNFNNQRHSITAASRNDADDTAKLIKVLMQAKGAAS